MTHSRRCAALFAFAVCLAAPGGLRWGNANEELAPKAKASALDTDVVPDDALAVISVHVAELWKHPLGKAFRANMGKELSEALKQTQLGVEPSEIDRLTVFVPSLSYAPLIVVTTEKPYDKKSVLAAAAPEAKESSRGAGRSYYYSDDRHASVRFLDDHRFLISSGGGLRTFLDNGFGPQIGPMAAVLKKAPDHFAVAAVDAAKLDGARRITFWIWLRGCYDGLYTANLRQTWPEYKGLPPYYETPPSVQGEPLSVTTLLKRLLFAELSMDLDKEVRVNLDLTYASKEDAANGAPAGDDALDVLRGAFAQEKQGQAGAPETSLRVLAFLNDVQAALRKVKVEQNTAVVEVRGTLKIDADATAGALIDGLDEAITPDGARDRVRIPNDLSMLRYAVFGYAAENGKRLPAAAIYDKNGKPLLSWRVLLLPHLLERNLYKEFHLDEPWDSEHNKKLLEKMPEIFAPKDTQAYKDHETHIQAFVGPGTAFEPPANPQPGAPPIRPFGVTPANPQPGAPPNGVTSQSGLKDTILFVEAKKAVPWTKPEDVPFDDGKLLPKVGLPNKGGFFAVTSGLVYFIPLTVKEETLRTWIMRSKLEKKPDLDK